MTDVTLTKKDFDAEGNYIGSIDFMKKCEGSVNIASGLGTVRFARLWVTGSIVANRCTGISAGWGISAGEGISAAGTLKVAYRVFAGVATWLKEPTPSQMEIRCAKFEGGVIAYGNLVLTGDAEKACAHTQTGRFCSECGESLWNEARKHD